MLRIIEIKKYITILLGKTLIIYTDHKSLKCKMFNNDRVLRRRLILEEYGQYIEYIQGDKHIVDLP